MKLFAALALCIALIHDNSQAASIQVQFSDRINGAPSESLLEQYYASHSIAEESSPIVETEPELENQETVGIADPLQRSAFETLRFILRYCLDHLVRPKSETSSSIPEIKPEDNADPSEILKLEENPEDIPDASQDLEHENSVSSADSEGLSAQEPQVPEFRTQETPLASKEEEAFKFMMRYWSEVLERFRKEEQGHSVAEFRMEESAETENIPEQEPENIEPSSSIQEQNAQPDEMQESLPISEDKKVPTESALCEGDKCEAQVSEPETIEQSQVMLSTHDDKFFSLLTALINYINQSRNGQSYIPAENTPTVSQENTPGIIEQSELRQEESSKDEEESSIQGKPTEFEPEESLPENQQEESTEDEKLNLIEPMENVPEVTQEGPSAEKPEEIIPGVSQEESSIQGGPSENAPEESLPVESISEVSKEEPPAEKPEESIPDVSQGESSIQGKPAENAPENSLPEESVSEVSQEEPPAEKPEEIIPGVSQEESYIQGEPTENAPEESLPVESISEVSKEEPPAEKPEESIPDVSQEESSIQGEPAENAPENSLPEESVSEVSEEEPPAEKPEEIIPGVSQGESSIQGEPTENSPEESLPVGSISEVSQEEPSAEKPEDIIPGVSQEESSIQGEPTENAPVESLTVENISEVSQEEPSEGKPEEGIPDVSQVESSIQGEPTENAPEDSLPANPQGKSSKEDNPTLTEDELILPVHSEQPYATALCDLCNRQLSPELVDNSDEQVNSNRAGSSYTKTEDTVSPKTLNLKNIGANEIIKSFLQAASTIPLIQQRIIHTLEEPEARINTLLTAKKYFKDYMRQIDQANLDAKHSIIESLDKVASSIGSPLIHILSK